MSFRAQHFRVLPPKLLHLGFHDVHLRGMRLDGERPKRLDAGITAEVLDHGVSQREGVLSERGDLILPQSH